jgi:pimeloyl-ACP methyl ester carboxylesterase
VKRSAILTNLLVLASYSATTYAQPVTPLAPGPEVDAFKKAQDALLKKYGVTAKSRYVKLKEPALTVHVLEAGRGEPLLLIHGGGGFACGFAPLLSALQKDFHVFAVDRPGCGLTDRFDYRETTIREHAVKFFTSAMDSLDVPKATLVANSMGGLWAMQFALAKPDRVTKVVLLGQPAWSPREMTSLPQPAKASTPIEGARAVLAAQLVADVKRVPDEFLEVAVANVRMPAWATSWNTLHEKFIKDKQGAYHLRPELKNLKAPTLFIWGDKDQYGPPTLGEEMARLMPKARCQVVSDAGHLPWLDQPEECNRLVLKFLNEGK